MSKRAVITKAKVEAQIASLLAKKTREHLALSKQIDLLDRQRSGLQNQLIRTRHLLDWVNAGFGFRPYCVDEYRDMGLSKKLERWIYMKCNRLRKPVR